MIENTTRITKLFVTGTMAIAGECGVTAEPAVEQKGQKCEPAGPRVRSAQKWNCAARKMSPSSRAIRPSRCRKLGMCVLRRSLGKEGCGVKGVKPSFCFDSYPSPPLFFVSVDSKEG